MYIHLLPQLVETIGLSSVLDKITIPEFSFVLNNESFKTGTPYPNKRYLVGSFKQRKDGIGLLLKTEKIPIFSQQYMNGNQQIQEK